MYQKKEAIDLSELKLISPMLDNFVMGEPMSDHHGVRCCPAMQNDSDERYIVKIISIPASQVQADALLMTGAFHNEESALAYFKELADDVVEEAEILKKLSAMEGFLSYSESQIEPMDGELGYDVYLISPYKQSLERHFRKKPMTHLGAVNLGLDLCAAMAVCRRAGYLYVDLKPGNVYLTGNNEYKIGDLGFLKLDSLKYASLPDRYRSAYTPPEIKDAFSPISETADIYAIGLIMYQAYNGGQLPFAGQSTGEAIPSPLFADYEMAEIIMRACDPDPSNRWQDPLAMGQALVAYMQRNSVNDTPIVPPPVTNNEPDEPVIENPIQPAPAQNEEAQDLDQILEGVSLDSGTDSDESDLRFMTDVVADETAPDAEHTEGIEYHELSGDISDMLSQADDLIAHETPTPVVAPEPIDIPMPEPIVLEEDAPAEETEDPSICENEDAYEEGQQVALKNQPKEKKKKGGKGILRFIGIMLACLILAGAAFGGYYYYSNYYLQSIDNLDIVGSENHLTVILDTDIDESLLTVYCTDTYGNGDNAPVLNGTATFSNLTANMIYTIRVEIDGFHQLKGETTGSYTTPDQTNILNFTAVAGSEDGSVVLSFTVDGKESTGWTVEYSAEGEETRSMSFTGHTVPITGLTLGKTYTFRLVSPTLLYIIGNNTVEFTASSLVYAKDLVITGCNADGLTATWSAPEGNSVTNWNVVCYNDSGYRQEITTDQNSVTFADIDPASSYNVEVTAEGMTVSTRAYVTANSATISNVQANTETLGQVEITWESGDVLPTGGWLLLYNTQGSTHQEVLRSETNKVILKPSLFGETYYFTIQAADGATVFNGNFSCTTPDAEDFVGFGVKKKHMTFHMCKTPEESNWNKNDLKDSDYTTTFKVGEKASFLVYLKPKYDSVRTNVVTTYVIRDEQGVFYSINTTEKTWRDMWYQHYCELDIPALPTVAGNYTMEIYFNGMSAGEVSFTMTE